MRADTEAVWNILEPAFRQGESYPLPQDINRKSALQYWFAPEHAVFVGAENGCVVGSYYLKANNKGGGDHVANCGYMTADVAQGRGVGRALCLHSLDEARRRRFTAMQFNFVVSTNTRALRLWQSCGFEIVGRLPRAFRHPAHGYVDSIILFREL
jgi:ribosomal protein S18 acetylase RimI-like enzyme